MSLRRELDRGGWVGVRDGVSILTAADGMLWVSAPRGTSPPVLAIAMLEAGIDCPHFRDPDPASDAVDLHKTRNWRWRPEDDGAVALAAVLRQLCAVEVPVKACDQCLDAIAAGHHGCGFSARKNGAEWDVLFKVHGIGATASSPSLERAIAACFCRLQVRP